MGTQQPLDPEDESAFKVSRMLPGQAESRLTYKDFVEWLERMEGESEGVQSWKELYKELFYAPDKPKWMDWRKVAYVVWLSLPASKRWPRTQAELADRLGLKSDETMRKWRKNHPELEQMIDGFTSGAVKRHAADIFDALIVVASTPEASAHADRELALEMAGFYKKKNQTALTNADGSNIWPDDDLSEFDDDELDAIIANLLAAKG